MLTAIAVGIGAVTMAASGVAKLAFWIKAKRREAKREEALDRVRVRKAEQG